MLLAIQPTDDLLESERDRESKRLLTWIVPVSLVLHAVALGSMPNAAARVTSSPPPVVVEMAEPPPPPAPTSTAEAPRPSDVAPPVAPKLVVAARLARAESAPSTATDESPVDFTGMTFSGEGAGVAVAAAAPSLAGTPGPKTAAPVVRSVASAPVVPASSLGRPPRAPGLDAELERNYPAEARRSGISGSATLQVELLQDGRIGKIVPLSESYPGFGSACERTVRAGRWEPPIDREGRAVRTEIKYVCRFEVRG